MKFAEKYQLAMRIIGTLALMMETYAYGPSIGLGVTHGILAYCIWFNRERTQ